MTFLRRAAAVGSAVLTGAASCASRGHQKSPPAQQDAIATFRVFQMDGPMLGVAAAGELRCMQMQPTLIISELTIRRQRGMPRWLPFLFFDATIHDLAASDSFPRVRIDRYLRDVGEDTRSLSPNDTLVVRLGRQTTVDPSRLRLRFWETVDTATFFGWSPAAAALSRRDVTARSQWCPSKPRSVDQ
jgi:hypothetical protein